MSWFSELTSKAEAMLVKLDQDAAEALQKPENLLKRAKLLDSAFKSINTYRSDPPGNDYAPTKSEENNRSDFGELSLDRQCDGSNQIETCAQSIALLDAGYDNGSGSSHNIQPEPGFLQQISEDTLKTQDTCVRDDNVIQELTNTTISAELPRQATTSSRFTMQTSGERLRHFRSNRPISKRNVTRNLDQTKYNEFEGAARFDSFINSARVDDIRASINQSLQEYTYQSYSMHARSDSRASTPACHSHFDNQPNLVRNPALVSSSYDNNLVGQEQPSSFSIDLPGDRFDNEQSSNIAARLLQQSASKRKSVLYLHRVINRLASHAGPSNTILGEQFKIKFRRAQLRAASYARRVNYLFRTYPTMRYLMLTYLVLMQILVVYVLFFYQSSSSSNDLSFQIRQQQQELNETPLGVKSDFEVGSPT